MKETRRVVGKDKLMTNAKDTDARPLNVPEAKDPVGRG